MNTDDFRSGFVSLLGRPNAGKSTLVNALLGAKISIVSPIPQTTRHSIRGILTLAHAQVVFVDTPGMHSFQDPLAAHLNSIARESQQGCDLCMYVVDVSRKFGSEEEAVIHTVLAAQTRCIMALNKTDRGQGHVAEYIAQWKDAYTRAGIAHDPVVCYVPLSAKTGKNVDVLRAAIIENLPCQPALYDAGTVTDFPLQFRVADCIREKLFIQLHSELPHSLAVEVEEIKEKKDITYVRAVIYVNRIGQKKIIIGTGGSILKEAGKQARQDIERMIGRRVFLDIWVKVTADWQSKPRILQELGYT